MFLWGGLWDDLIARNIRNIEKFVIIRNHKRVILVFVLLTAEEQSPQCLSVFICVLQCTMSINEWTKLPSTRRPHPRLTQFPWCVEIPTHFPLPIIHSLPFLHFPTLSYNILHFLQYSTLFPTIPLAFLLRSYIKRVYSASIQQFRCWF